MNVEKARSCSRACITETQATAAERWNPRAGHSGDKQSSKGHEDIVHFVWVKCVYMCDVSRGQVNFLSLGLVIN